MIPPVVPDPPGYRFCPTVASKAKNAPSCTNDNAAQRLRKAMEADGVLQPSVAGTAFQAHHIFPSSWGGGDAVANGIYLPVLEHDNFTFWWVQANFTP